MAATADAAAYQIRPSFAEKFRPATVKTLISAVLSERLADKTCATPACPPHLPLPLLCSWHPLIFLLLLAHVATLAPTGTIRN